MDTTRTADERKRRLLLVEDDHAVSEALVDLLAMLEHQADAAASGAKALELFERHRYDLVLTDLLMPGMTGWEVLAAVRGRDPRIPVIVISGSTVDAKDPRVTRRRGVAVLPKPVDALRLHGTINRLLAERGSDR